MAADLHIQVIEIIEETINDIERDCVITLYDIYGSSNGFQIMEYEESTGHERPTKEPYHPRRGDQVYED